MASITAGQLLIRLQGAAGRASAAEAEVASIPSTVMDPDATDVPSQDELQVRTRLTLFSDKWTGASAAVLGPSMSAIAADADAKAALLSAVAADLDNFKAELMVSMQARIKAKTDHICKVLQQVAADASTLTGEARALLSAPSTAPTTSLRVAGTTGVTKQQARRQWKEARTQVAESWSKRREALARRLAELESLTDGSSHDADSKADLRASVKDQQAMSDAMLCGIYAVYGGDGEDIKRDSSDYKPFPVPKQLDDGNYEKFKASYKKWRSAPATVREYSLILFDLDYIFDAVDAVEAMHLLPPDCLESWIEADKHFDEHLTAARQEKWLELHRELHQSSSDKVRDWTQIIHAVGQHAKHMVEIKDGDGLNFMYALLGAHVKFTAADQQFHSTALMQLHTLFSDSEGGADNIIKAIEEARTKLRHAREVGVFPEYDLCGRDLIAALGSVSTEIYNDLHREKLFDPEVLVHKKFNSLDCSTIVQSALTQAMSIVKKRAKREDRIHPGQRKANEAGAEVTAFRARADDDEDEGVTKKRKRQVDHCVLKSSSSRDLSSKNKKNLHKYAMANLAECEDFHELELHVEACALTLTNGEKLQEPIIRKHVKKLQGKMWKGKSPGPSTSPRKDFKQPRCSVQGCDNKVNVNRKTGTPFKTCREHADKPAKDHSERHDEKKKSKYSANSADTESVTLEDAQGNKIDHVLDANTIEVVRMLKSGTMKIAEDAGSCKDKLAAFAADY